MTRNRLIQFKLEDYKAFANSIPIDLANLTLVMGRNNSGKSALCRAPIFLTQCLQPDAWTPFRLKAQGIDFGKRFTDVVYQRHESGFRGQLRFDNGTEQTELLIGATENASNREIVVTELVVRRGQRTEKAPARCTWEQARAVLRAFPDLATIPQEIVYLHGVRVRPQRDYEYPGGQPPTVGAEGELAPAVLAQDQKSAAPYLLEALNKWFGDHLKVSLNLLEEADHFAITVSARGAVVNLADAGEGFGQLLPVAVALLSLGRPAPTALAPSFYVIEQPELHLHPFAHAAVAELLIDAACKEGAPRLLVETHSDNLILRIRRAVAEGRLTPAQVRLYYVDDQDPNSMGSEVRAIHLDDRGTPDFWPKGVFAENLAEFRQLQQVLAARDARSSR